MMDSSGEALKPDEGGLGDTPAKSQAKLALALGVIAIALSLVLGFVHLISVRRLEREVARLSQQTEGFSRLVLRAQEQSQTSAQQAESVQDEEDLENSTVDKIRRVMHLVYSTAQANDLIPRTPQANPLSHVHISTTTEYEAILVTPQEAWSIVCRVQPFPRLLTLLIAVTGLRIGEVLALRWNHVHWTKLRIRVVSNFVRGRFGAPKSAASKKPVVLHPLVMGLLRNWRETTAYAAEQNLIFASDRLKGKQPRVLNMLVEDHLRPARNR